MKHVIHVITTISRGGAENQLLVLTKEQVLAGRKVTVVFLKDSPDLLDKFRHNGVEVIQECALRPFFNQIVWFRNFLKNRDVLIHAHLPRAETLVAFALKKIISL